jgi:Arc/MetJ family transcription regulator
MGLNGWDGITVGGVARESPSPARLLGWTFLPGRAFAGLAFAALGSGSDPAFQASQSAVPLTRMHGSTILMHMRTTLILDDDLVERAKELSGLAEKTAVVHAGLEALIARESARRLATLGGSEPRIQAARRRRSRPGSPL